MTSRDIWLERFAGMRQWRRGKERAPHKPLLVLLALGDLHRGHGRLHSFVDIDERLGKLLRRFGPPTKPSPQYPFVRLTGDLVWETPRIDECRSRESNTDPPRSALLEANVEGGFPLGLHELLIKDPALVTTIAEDLLERNFPQSMHDEILDAVGLGDLSVRRKRRDPSFRPSVLLAYQERCAVCSLDTRLDGQPILIEAAHIMWHNMGGPDEVANGLALCVLHHKAFDRGAIGLTEDHRIVVSAHAIGGARHEKALVQFHGSKLHRPIDDADLPLPEHIQWHANQVFRGSARPL